MTLDSISIEERFIYSYTSIVENKFDKIPRKSEIFIRTNSQFWNVRVL